MLDVRLGIGVDDAGERLGDDVERGLAAVVALRAVRKGRHARGHNGTQELLQSRKCQRSSGCLKNRNVLCNTKCVIRGAGGPRKTTSVILVASTL